VALVPDPLVYVLMSQGHKHTHSVTQNHKALLANAYNELGKELTSSKIRVVGNYTLGKVIGEGKCDPYLSKYSLTILQVHMGKFAWAPIV
jgi:hypothetical protein